jgi:hypothetical protein
MPTVIHSSPSGYHLKASRTESERIVLWCNLHLEVIAKDRNLRNDVLAHARYFGEEEEDEDSGCDAEGSCNCGTTKFSD